MTKETRLLDIKKIVISKIIEQNQEIREIIKPFPKTWYLSSEIGVKNKGVFMKIAQEINEYITFRSSSISAELRMQISKPSLKSFRNGSKKVIEWTTFKTLQNFWRSPGKRDLRFFFLLFIYADFDKEKEEESFIRYVKQYREKYSQNRINNKKQINDLLKGKTRDEIFEIIHLFLENLEDKEIIKKSQFNSLNESFNLTDNLQSQEYLNKIKGNYYKYYPTPTDGYILAKLPYRIGGNIDNGFKIEKLGGDFPYTNLETSIREKQLYVELQNTSNDEKYVAYYNLYMVSNKVELLLGVSIELNIMLEPTATREILIPQPNDNLFMSERQFWSKLDINHPCYLSESQIDLREIDLKDENFLSQSFNQEEILMIKYFKLTANQNIINTPKIIQLHKFKRSVEKLEKDHLKLISLLERLKKKGCDTEVIELEKLFFQ